MKFGIKVKLLITYILAIVIPILVILILLFLFQYYFLNELNEDSLLSEVEIISQTVEKIDQNYANIDDYDLFYSNVMENLNGDNNHIIIVDLNNKLLFDSNDKEATYKGTTYNISEVDRYQIKYKDSMKRYVVVNAPIIKNGEVNGYMELTLNRFVAVSDVEKRVKNFLLLVISVVAAVIILLIALFTLTISNGVIKPLKYLSESLQKIKEGNLEDKIEYRKNNEFGQFSSLFDEMRIELKKSLEKQQELELTRNEMIASISHDLRTPITSIKGYVEAFEDGLVKDEEKKNRYLAIIKNKTNQLNQLIDDLFQFSKLELNQITLNKETINSKDLIENIITNYKSEFNLLSISFEVKEPIPSVELMVDTYYISRVFDNIFQNAKRYLNPDGIIKLECSVIGNDFLVLVQDNGPGIKQEDINKIFNRFYRGEKSRSRDFGGTGLGLAICKQIIEKHEGEIWVESEYGKGSSFYFKIPILNRAILGLK